MRIATALLTLLLSFLGIWATGIESKAAPVSSDTTDTLTHPYFPYQEGDRLFFAHYTFHIDIPIASGAHRADVVVDSVGNDGNRYYTFARKWRDSGVLSDTVHYQQEYSDSIYYAVDPDSNIMQYNPEEETYHKLLKWQGGSPDEWEEQSSWEVEKSNQDHITPGPLFYSPFIYDDIKLEFTHFEDNEDINLAIPNGRYKWVFKEDVGAYSFIDVLPTPPSPIELRGGIIQGESYADSTIFIYRDPSVPGQIAPDDGADGFESELTFSWDETWPNELYEFQLSEGPDHDEVILSDTLTETSIVLGYKQLESHTTYSWRVRAIREVNLPETNYMNSHWSSTCIFETGEMTSAEEDDQIPLEVSLEQNYPNPFNPDTQIRYELPEQSPVTLQVYTITGEHITTLVDDTQPAGSHSVVFEGTGFASSMYIYRLETAEQVKSKTMMLIK